jgi:hypothetical protein
MSETVFDEGDESYDYNPSAEKNEFIRNWTFERQTQFVEEWNRKSLKSAMSKFKLEYRDASHRTYAYRVRKYVDEMETTRGREKEVGEFLYQKFLNARQMKLPIDDNDLRRWALEKANELNLVNFKASASFILTFKKDHHIRSRKITKFVTTHTLYDAKEIVALAKQFNEVAKGKFKDYSEDQIFNSDQSGFNFEMASKRTLSEVGEKHTSILMTSSSALTHSYTVKPMISLSADIVG